MDGEVDQSPCRSAAGGGALPARIERARGRVCCLRVEYIELQGPFPKIETFSHISTKKRLRV